MAPQMSQDETPDEEQKETPAAAVEKRRALPEASVNSELWWQNHHLGWSGSPPSWTRGWLTSSRQRSSRFVAPLYQASPKHQTLRPSWLGSFGERVLENKRLDILSWQLYLFDSAGCGTGLVQLLHPREQACRSITWRDLCRNFDWETSSLPWWWTNLCTSCAIWMGHM